MEVTLSRSPSSDFGDSDSSSIGSDQESEQESGSDSDSSEAGHEGGVEDNDCDCDECSSNRKNGGERKSVSTDRMNMYALNWRATKAPSEVVFYFYETANIFKCNRNLGSSTQSD